MLLLAGLFPLLPLQAETATVAVNSVQADLLDLIEGQARHDLDIEIQQFGWHPEASNVQGRLPAGTAHLPPCKQAVQINRSNPSSPTWGHQTYLLRCPDQPGWQTRGDVDVSLALPVWVTAHALDRDHAIEASDLQSRLVNVSELLRNFSPTTQSLIGFRTQMRLPIGELISQERLAKPLAVRKGEPVMMYARKDGFAATDRGEAQADGSLGAVIPVKNLTSGKIIQARVTGPNEVDTLF